VLLNFSPGAWCKDKPHASGLFKSLHINGPFCPENFTHFLMLPDFSLVGVMNGKSREILS
jgi:hypothetical protein